MNSYNNNNISHMLVLNAFKFWNKKYSSNGNTTNATPPFQNSR